MKRIDEKILEIKKSERRSLIYKIIIGVLTVGFIIYAIITINIIRANEIEIKSMAAKNEELNALKKQEFLDSQKILTETIKQYEDQLSITSELTTFNIAVSSNSVDAFLSYVTDENSTGLYNNQAFEALEAIGRTGWLYCGREDNNSMTESIVDVLWRDGTEASDLTNAIPQTGDIVALNSSSRFTYSDKDRNNKNSSTWLNGSKARVLDVATEGNAVIIKIIYD